MGIYIIASVVLVLLWGLTALIYDNEGWYLDISTGLSILLIPIGIICETGFLIFIGVVLWITIKGGKPTPLGVGWIACLYKNN